MSVGATRQGSASYTIVLGALAALVVGGLVLTFMFYPIVSAFMAADVWSTQTTAGADLETYTEGLWTFWGAVILLGILSFVWVRSRQ